MEHIKDIKVVNGPWRKKIIKKLYQNFGVKLENIYSQNKLIEINLKSIEYCREKLNITTPIIYSSDLNVKGNKSELLANLVKKVGGDTYLSGPSGKDYLDKTYFKDLKIKYFIPKVENYYSMLYNIHRK